MIRHISLFILSVLLAFPASAQTQHTVTLSWTPSLNADHYTMYRTTTPGSNYSPLGTVTAPPFVDSTVTHCTTYYYAVTAIESGTESAKTPDLKVIIDTPTDPCVAPGNPSNLSGSAK